MYLDSAWGWGNDFILRQIRHWSVYENGWNYNSILYWTPISTDTAINATNVRAVCPGRTRHPLQIFNERISTQSSYRHYFSVFGQHNIRIKLRTAQHENQSTTWYCMERKYHVPNASIHAGIQTYGLFVQGQHDTRFMYIQQTKDQRRVVMHRHCSVFGRTTRKSEIITTPHCIYRISITRAKFLHTHAAIQTHALFIQWQYDTRSIHSTNED